MSFAVSDTTQKILKNFSAISDQIVLKARTTQRTVLQSLSVFSVAELPEPWPQDTPIYKLREFCAFLSNYDKPVIEFTPEGMVVHQEVGTPFRDTIRYSDPSTIESAPERVLPTEKPAIQFVLSAHAIKAIKNRASLMRLTNFNINAQNGSVVIVGTDPKMPNSNKFEFPVYAADTTVHDATYVRAMSFQVEHFGYLIDGDYSVSLKDWKYIYLEHKSLPITYFIAEDRNVE